MRQSEPLISVIVPAYGVAHLLGEALSSLQAQSFADWEAIVVDDGAPDDVAGAWAPFASDSRIRLLLTDNGGVAIARNRAFAESRGRFIALLDGDDAYEPSYLATMIDAIRPHPEVGFVTCDAIYFGLADRAGRRFSAFHPQDGEVTLERIMRQEFNVFTACVMRREAIDSVGGYDTTLRSVEDLDLWIRLVAAGWRGLRVDQPLVHYRRRPGSLSFDTMGMLRASRQVWEKMIVALAGRPEEAVARSLLADIIKLQRWTNGENLIEAGEVARGLDLMRGTRTASLRWRMAMPLMRMFPKLAVPLLKIRAHLPEPPRPS